MNIDKSTVENTNPAGPGRLGESASAAGPLPAFAGRKPWSAEPVGSPPFFFGGARDRHSGPVVTTASRLSCKQEFRVRIPVGPRDEGKVVDPPASEAGDTRFESMRPDITGHPAVAVCLCGSTDRAPVYEAGDSRFDSWWRRARHGSLAQRAEHAVEAREAGVRAPGEPPCDRGVDRYTPHSQCGVAGAVPAGRSKPLTPGRTGTGLLIRTGRVRSPGAVRTAVLQWPPGLAGRGLRCSVDRAAAF